MQGAMQTCHAHNSGRGEEEAVSSRHARRHGILVDRGGQMWFNPSQYVVPHLVVLCQTKVYSIG